MTFEPLERITTARMTNDVQILFRLPASLLKQIDRTAKRMTLTRSAVVRLLVLKGLEVDRLGTSATYGKETE